MYQVMKGEDDRNSATGDAASSPVTEVDVDRLFTDLPLSGVNEYVKSLKHQIYVKQEDIRGLVLSKYPVVVDVADRLDEAERLSYKIVHELDIVFSKDFDKSGSPEQHPGETESAEPGSTVKQMRYGMHKISPIKETISELLSCIRQGQILIAARKLKIIQHDLDELKLSSEVAKTREILLFSERFPLKSIIKSSAKQVLREYSADQQQHNSPRILASALCTLSLLDGDLSRRLDIIGCFLDMRLRTLDQWPLDTCDPLELIKYHTSTLSVAGVLSKQLSPTTCGKLFETKETAWWDEDLWSSEIREWALDNVQLFSAVLEKLLFTVDDSNELERVVNVVCLMKNVDQHVIDMVVDSVRSRNSVLVEDRIHNLISNVDKYLRENVQEKDWWDIIDTEDDNLLETNIPTHNSSVECFLEEAFKSCSPVNFEDRLWRVEGRRCMLGRLLENLRNLEQIANSRAFINLARLIQRYADIDHQIFDELDRLIDNQTVQWTDRFIKENIVNSDNFLPDLNRPTFPLIDAKSESYGSTGSYALPACASQVLMQLILKFVVDFDVQFFGELPCPNLFNSLFSSYSNRVVDNLKTSVHRTLPITVRQLLFDCLYMTANCDMQPIRDNRLMDMCKDLIDTVDLVLIRDQLREQVVKVSDSTHIMFNAGTERQEATKNVSQSNVQFTCPMVKSSTQLPSSRYRP